MPIKAITLDAYGTLLRNESLMLISQRIVADHRLSVSVDDVWRMWMALYFEATQVTPFRTLRVIQETMFSDVLRYFDVRAAAVPYVELFFQLTTQVQLYPAAWNFTLPVRLILISETVKAYKPHRLMFETAVEQLGLQPHEVLHVGDSDVDDVQGAKSAGLQVAWVNRDGRSRRFDVPKPDFEIIDLTELLRLL